MIENIGITSTILGQMADVARKGIELNVRLEAMEPGQYRGVVRRKETNREEVVNRKDVAELVSSIKEEYFSGKDTSDHLDRRVTTIVREFYESTSETLFRMYNGEQRLRKALSDLVKLTT